ncbi:MAG: hypothetical protein RSF73_04990 [Ruthenibacterium sp.]
MIPAQRRKAKKDTLQQARRRRGAEWENDLCAALDASGWAHQLDKGWSGHPYDISAVLNGIPFAVECKRIATGNLGYSAFTSNEIENLTRFEDAGGKSIVAIKRDVPDIIVFVPWYCIRAAVLGGERGSVKPEHYPKTLADALEVMHP